MIRQFKIHLNFLQNFCVHSRPLARSAAHPLRGLKHGTADTVDLKKYVLSVKQSTERVIIMNRKMNNELTLTKLIGTNLTK